MDTLPARLGDYRDFFGEALRRLRDPAFPALRALGARELADPTIALLDAWAIVADILTFYRERLTNEGYLRTARDEYAIREIAALIGFEPRPGVSATAHLAYLLDKAAAPVEIPARARAQTVPGPGEQMQAFETGDALQARAAWSQMSPRRTRPAAITLLDALLLRTVRLRGDTLIVRPGERILFMFGTRTGFQVVRRVEDVHVDVLQKIVELRLQPRVSLDRTTAMRLIDDPAGRGLAQLRDTLDANGQAAGRARDLLNLIGSFFLGGTAADGAAIAGRIADTVAGELKAIAERLRDTFRAIEDRIRGLALREAAGTSVTALLQPLGRQRMPQLASGRRVARTAARSLAESAGARSALLAAAMPHAAANIAAALDTLPVTPVSSAVAPSVYLLRTTAGAFGAVAPPQFTQGGGTTEHDIDERDRTAAFLDAAYEGITADSLTLIDQPENMLGRPSAERVLRLARVRAAQVVARGGYNLSGKSTRLDLIDPDDPRREVKVLPDSPDLKLTALRDTLYHVHSEPVALADSVDDRDVAGGQIELQDRVEALESGRWLIVTGERSDVRDANGAPVPGLRDGELAMVLGTRQVADEHAPGDTLHTVIDLVTPLSYSYRRSTVTIYGNVAEASHGETVEETLGSGDATVRNQRFSLSRQPLTFTSAATTSGVLSSETIRVNGVRYRRVASLLDAGPSARAYEMETDPDGSATVRFGDGVHGTRLPSGPQNVRAAYRVGMGPAGNVRAGQISLLTTRPLGVTGVINPLGASGGADRDRAEQVRRNAPLAARALSPLSRLVSVEDYAHFARRFAGIGQAEAVKLTDGAQHVVLVTVAGVGDGPLDTDGDVLANLRSAYAAYGDPAMPIEILVRELKVLIVQARVAIDPDLLWEDVEPRVRRHLLSTFGADARALGQTAYLSEVAAAMHAVGGVSWVDIDRFGGITEQEVRDPALLASAVGRLHAAPRVDVLRGRANPGWSPGQHASRFLGAQLAVLSPAIPDLVALNLVTTGVGDAR